MSLKDRKRESEAADKADAARLRPMRTLAEFVAGFVPPDYLIDQTFQKRYLYATTAMTGAGKTAVWITIALHVATGKPLHGRYVVKSRVLYCAGENPDDIRARMIMQIEKMGLDPATVDIVVVDGSMDMNQDTVSDHIRAEAEKYGPFGLVIIDTSAAYFYGEEENSNRDMLDHARAIRSLVDLPGGPAVVVLCHPTKNGESNLPRGGGAFVAEIDGNTFITKKDAVVELNRHDKFRGRMWEPMAFKLDSGTSEKLRDSRGRSVWTVTATPISDSEKAELDNTTDRRRDDLLALMKAKPGLSLEKMARELKWPRKSAVQKMIEALKVEKPKLIEMKDGHWTLTTAGKKAAGDWRGPEQASMNLSDGI
ncbi:MAG: helicase RepA family protein [Xanthobacteraceae bacterium]|nr:helicase RepA family protein [Xanthobacteraceae bacterium]